MNYSTHSLGGIVAGLLAVDTIKLSGILGLGIDLGCIFISYEAAILPDIDTPTSYISKKFPLISIIISFGGHRHLTHSIIFPFFLLIIVSYYLSNKIFILIILSIVLGWFSHIFLDSLTIKGVPLFSPFINKNFNFGKINSKKSSWWINIILIIIIIILISCFFF